MEELLQFLEYCLITVTPPPLLFLYLVKLKIIGKREIIKNLKSYISKYYAILNAWLDKKTYG